MVDLLAMCWEDFRLLTRDVFGDDDERHELADTGRRQQHEPASSDKSDDGGTS